MAEATETETTQTETPPPAGEQDAAYWKAEARKAFSARDEFKGKLRELEGRTLSDDDRKLFETLKAQHAKLEENRKRKEGEFDTWRADILKKHDEALTAETQKREAAEVKLRQKLIGLEFAAASSLFGETGKTVLTPDVAEAYLSRHVDVQADDQGNERVVVKDSNGHVIISAKDGKPASFVEAMDEVIAGLPNRDRILRGSGKSGSGSSGGTNQPTNRGQIDTSRLKSDDFSDPKVREAVRAQQNKAGGLQFGRAFDRLQKAKP